MFAKFLFYPTDVRVSPHGIVLLGVTKENKRIAVLDPTYRPWLLVKEQDFIKLNRLWEKQNLKPIHWQEEGEFIRIYFEPKSFTQAVLLGFKTKIFLYNADLPLRKRYWSDKNFTPFSLYCVSGETWAQELFKVDFSIIAENIQQIETNDLPKILAFDIETACSKMWPDPKNDPIISIAIYSENFKQVLTWKRFSQSPNYIKFVDSEAELLMEFFEILKQQNPFALIGYGSENFDLPYILERTKKYDLKLDLNWAENQDLIGFLHIDIAHFIKTFLDLDTSRYNLDQVSKKILGKGKLDHLSPNKINEIWSVGLDIELKHLLEYNLTDAQLTFELFETFFPFLKELVKLTKLHFRDLFHASYSMLVEWFILANSKVPIPKKPFKREVFDRIKKTFQGAFVVEPKPGLYSNICCFDFRSLYPSIIASHNISPDTINCACCKPSDSFSIGDVWFCSKKQGFLAILAKELIERRARINEIIKQNPDKKELVELKARSQALKRIAASFYGYLGFPASRFYCLDCAKAVTFLGRKYIDMVIGEAKKFGFEILYGDTDSLFVERKDKDPFLFLKLINNILPKPMELELKGIYKTGLFFGKKEGEGGAKKRYALLAEDGSIVLKGVEAIRSDWSSLAKEAQKEVLRILLLKQDLKEAIAYVRNLINSIKNKKVNLRDLVISVKLTKNITSYKAKGPHVVAAQIAKAKGYPLKPGSVLNYIVTKGGEKISTKVKLFEEATLDDYDADYYVNHQLIRAVYKIFEIFGVQKEQLLWQKTLQDY
ncbi:MAG: DNA-directed DNA polymerase [Candidatus Nanoarchaeia archaeon]